ncbi:MULTISPECIES: hypothetical protein [unclassified Pseudoalteromonas]|uniref:hypothetical protein n=1 Tax=unclassified Pseudoalteromonas TaxID=194690 RepID=UPI001F3FC147|nr:MULTISPECIES: hypothetical protein [unclassified Pseudoalteromonas]MCF2826897.1 hypothetical protein [Pseudoalteromonas sp. OF5H-5]MCF2830594.1 hypothetical protein [Pseudoalteromonas sp. DL2-H6]MCF2923974.1 hypothetical protein [Pseudoalteromonas sp. DL2-H1]
MTTINSTLTARQIAEQTVSILERFYVGNTSGRNDISVGLTLDGDVDYTHNCFNEDDIAVELFNTQNGFDSLGDYESEYDESKEEFWTDEVKDAMAECFVEWNLEQIKFNEDYTVNLAE